ncbi:MAG: hypothetical protein SOV56_05335 [Phascolarctobacterium sp.]|nr:hypothetical protein [Phascolarctobacterium sp.]
MLDYLLKFKYARISTYLYVIIITLMPYLETGPFAFAYTNSSKTFQIRSILLFQILLLVYLIFRLLKSKVFIIKNNILFFWTVYSFCNGVMSVALGADIGAVVVTSFSFILPLLNATIIAYFIDRDDLDIVVKYTINIYAIFIVYCIIFNTLNYGMSINFLTNHYRLTAPAGGPVILGYTISFFTLFMIVNRFVFSKLNLYLNMAVFTLGIIYTMDRGAYIILFLCISYVFATSFNNNSINVLVFSIVMSAFLLFSDSIMDIVDMLFMNRVMENDFSDSMRYVTSMSCIYDMLNEPIYSVFGHGLGNFFPFQQWTAFNKGASEIVYEDFTFNLFLYKGSLLLVQPHNTFIYFLMETGVIGVLFFLQYVISNYQNIGRKRKLSVAFTITAFLILSVLESTIIVQPGISCIWWFILIITKRISLEH